MLRQLIDREKLNYRYGKILLPIVVGTLSAALENTGSLHRRLEDRRNKLNAKIRYLSIPRGFDTVQYQPFRAQRDHSPH